MTTFSSHGLWSSQYWESRLQTKVFKKSHMNWHLEHRSKPMFRYSEYRLFSKFNFSLSCIAEEQVWSSNTGCFEGAQNSEGGKCLVRLPSAFHGYQIIWCWKYTNIFEKYQSWKKRFHEVFWKYIGCTFQHKWSILATIKVHECIQFWFIFFTSIKTLQKFHTNDFHKSSF